MIDFSCAANQKLVYNKSCFLPPQQKMAKFQLSPPNRPVFSTFSLVVLLLFAASIRFAKCDEEPDSNFWLKNGQRWQRAVVIDPVSVTAQESPVPSIPPPTINRMIDPDSLFSSFPHNLHGELAYDREQTIYLVNGETKRLYFQTSTTWQQPNNDNISNISLTIMPCESSIRWELFFISSKSIRKFRKRKVRRTKPYWVKFINRKLSSGSKQLLLNHSGAQRFTYSEQSLRTGLYVVQLSSNDGSDLSARLYLSNVSNGADFRHRYPSIPPVASVLSKQIFDRKIRRNYRREISYAETDENRDPKENEIDLDHPTASNIHKSSRKSSNVSVELWWNPAIRSDSQPDSLYEYCVVISAGREYRSNCLPRKNNLHNELEQDTEPDRSLASTIARLDSFRSDMIHHFECYNTTRAIIVNRLRPNQRYFVDVFVRNRITDGTAKYWTANFTLKPVPPARRRRPRPMHGGNASNRGGGDDDDDDDKGNAEDESRHTINANIEQRIYDGLFTGIYLDSKSRYRTRMIYRTSIVNSEDSRISDSGDENAKIHLFVQPCDGQGPIQVVVRQAMTRNNESNLEYYRRRRHNFSDYSPNTNRDDEEDDNEAGDDNDNEDQDDEDDDDDRRTVSINEKQIFAGAHDEESNDRGLLLLDEIAETKTFELLIPKSVQNSGNLVLKFELNTLGRRKSRSLVLLASSELARFPFPRLPADRNIREFESLRGCDRLTLAWYPSPDERVVYCVHQRDADQPLASFKESREFCAKINPLKMSPSKRAMSSAIAGEDAQDLYVDQFMGSTRQVICRRYKSPKRRRSNLIVQEVRRLTPGKRYIFQVTVSKGRGRSLNYEQVWTETKDIDSCLGPL